MHAIQIKKEFNAPVAQVFELLSKHATYNIAFAPMQVVRIKDSADPERPDGVVRCVVWGLGQLNLCKSNSKLPCLNRISGLNIKSLKIH